MLLGAQFFGHRHQRALVGFVVIDLVTLCQKLGNALIDFDQLSLIPFFVVLMSFVGVGPYFGAVHKQDIAPDQPQF